MPTHFLSETSVCFEAEEIEKQTLKRRHTHRHTHTVLFQRFINLPSSLKIIKDYQL